MENVSDLLLIEVVKFLELCQTCMLNGKMTKDNYFSHTSKKLDFVENVLESNNSISEIDKELLARINKLKNIDCCIYNSTENKLDDCFCKTTYNFAN